MPDSDANHVAISTSTPANPSENPGVTKIEAFGAKAELPLPRWAIACIAVVLIAVSAVGGAYYAYDKIATTTLVPKEQLNVYLATQFHDTSDTDKKDTSTQDYPDDGILITVIHFHSDGCVEIVRYDKAKKKGDAKWMFGPHAHTGNPEPEKAGVESGQSLKTLQSVQLDDGEIQKAVASLKLERSSFDSTQSKFTNLKRIGYQGRCLDPHPGPFNYSNQVVNQCLIQVWRYFPDGCIHFQYFNPCNGSWDVYPNGAAHVTWTRCVH